MSIDTESVSFVQLEPIEKGETVPDGLTARLDYKSVQAAVDGLRCTVTIENAADKARKLHNPYDVLTYVLGDADGWPIGLAAPASRLKLHRQTADLGKRKAYLDVIAVSRNGVASNTDEELAEDDISIGGHEHYVYEVAIRHAHPAYQDPQTVDIGPGRYTVRFLLLLRTASLRSSSAIVQTRDVTIELT